MFKTNFKINKNTFIFLRKDYPVFWFNYECYLRKYDLRKFILLALLGLI